MISAIQRRLELARREVARPPLTRLVQWVCVHSLGPLSYVPPTRDFVRMICADIGRRLRDLADDGVFLFFGIRDAAEMGNAPVSLRAVRYDHGRVTVTVNEAPLVAWIIGGGAGLRGWRAPSSLTLDALAG